MQGQLSPFLLPESILEHTIRQIEHKLEHKLAKEYNKFYLIHNIQPSFNHHFILYLTVRFPISSHEKPLTLYQILSLPVRINSTSNHASKLLDMPDYLALSNHRDQFSIIKQKQLSKCTKTHSAIVCDFNVPLISTTIPNCKTALFFNKKEQIRNVCNFRFNPNLLESNLIKLTPTSVLLYNVNNINVQIIKKCHKGVHFVFLIFHVNVCCQLNQWFLRRD